MKWLLKEALPVVILWIASSRAVFVELDECAEASDTLSLLQLGVQVEKSVSSNLLERPAALKPSLTNATRPTLASSEIQQLMHMFAPPQLMDQPLVKHVPGDTDLYVLDPYTTNAMALAMVAFTVCAIWAGYGYSEKESHCPAWVVATLIVSYSMWFFGFFFRNSAYLVVTRSQFGTPLVMTFKTQLGPLVPGPFTETPWEIVHTLMQEPSPYIATIGYVVAVMAIGDPILKLVLMVAGEFLRRSESTVRTARSCLIFVQVITKWASPIFFLAILMHCAALSLDDGATVGIKAVLDVGWVGYMLFCITNVVSALSIKLPTVDISNRPKRSSWAVQLFGKSAVACMVGVFSLCYLSLLGVALLAKSFSFDSPEASNFLSERGVSVWDCFTMLASRGINSWQVTPFLAAFVLLVFVGLLPCVDACALIATCFYIRRVEMHKARTALKISRFTRHALMSDVIAITLVLVHNMGRLTLHEGAAALGIAEILRYFVTYGILESVCVTGLADGIDDGTAFGNLQDSMPEPKVTFPVPK